MYRRWRVCFPLAETRLIRRRPLGGHPFTAAQHRPPPLGLHGGAHPVGGGCNSRRTRCQLVGGGCGRRGWLGAGRGHALEGDWGPETCNSRRRGKEGWSGACEPGTRLESPHTGSGGQPGRSDKLLTRAIRVTGTVCSGPFCPERERERSGGTRFPVQSATACSHKYEYPLSCSSGLLVVCASVASKGGGIEPTNVQIAGLQQPAHCIMP